MPQPEVPESLVNLAQAVIETERLRKWFAQLEQLPSAVRDAAFSEMAAQIRSDGKDAALADAVASLADPKIYQSVLEAVRERVGEVATQQSRESVTQQ
jgi:hypothetical protein